MPELDIVEADGNLSKDALAKIMGAMHFPSDQLKRKMLEDYFSVNRHKVRYDDDYDPDMDSISPKTKAYWMGKSALSALIPKLKLHNRDGFIAGHWLVYLIYANRRDDTLSSTNGWVEYVETYLMPTLQKKLKTVKWISGRKTLVAALEQFWPVAHLWAAATYNEEFRRRMLSKDAMLSVNRPFMNSDFGNLNRDFVGLAAGLLEAARQAGAYSQPRAKREWGGVWSIPAGIPRIEPQIDHPDHLLNIDFAKVTEGYVTHTYSDRIDRDSRRKTVNPTFVEPKSLGDERPSTVSKTAEPKRISARLRIPPPIRKG